MALNFRNVNASPSDPVASWPYEALVTAIEQGLVPDWHPIFDQLRLTPGARCLGRSSGTWSTPRAMVSPSCFGLLSTEHATTPRLANARWLQIAFEMRLQRPA